MPIGAPPVPKNSATRQPERDQQDVVHPGMERRRHLTQQHTGRLDIQRHRQLPGIGIRVHLGLHRRQHGGDRRHLPPGLGLVHHFRVVGILSQQRRPPGKRRAAGRQRHRLPAAMLCPGDVQVLQQDPPRHPVDGQMVNDQHQLARRSHPHRAEHRPGGRVQPRPRRHHRLIGQHVDRLQAARPRPPTRPRAPSTTNRRRRRRRRAAAAWRADPAAPAAAPPRRPR